MATIDPTSNPQTTTRTATPEEIAELEARAARNRESDPILKFFECNHLPIDLRNVARHFKDLAEGVIMSLPRSAERTVALRKLLESKDAAVRAALP